MSDPALGLTMLGLIVIAIMMGFPTAFTLMGLGMLFGYVAFWQPGQFWYDNRIFDLMELDRVLTLVDEPPDLRPS